MLICDTLNESTHVSVKLHEANIRSGHSVGLCLSQSAQIPDSPEAFLLIFTVFISTVVQLLQLYQYTCYQVGDQEVGEFDLNERVQNINYDKTVI